MCIIITIRITTNLEGMSFHGYRDYLPKNKSKCLTDFGQSQFFPYTSLEWFIISIIFY